MDYSKDYNDLPTSFFDGEPEDDSSQWLDEIILDKEDE